MVDLLFKLLDATPIKQISTMMALVIAGAFALTAYWARGAKDYLTSISEKQGVIHEKVDVIVSDVANIKVRVSASEIQIENLQSRQDAHDKKQDILLESAINQQVAKHLRR